MRAEPEVTSAVDESLSEVVVSGESFIVVVKNTSSVMFGFQTPLNKSQVIHAAQRTFTCTGIHWNPGNASLLKRKQVSLVNTELYMPQYTSTFHERVGFSVRFLLSPSLPVPLYRHRALDSRWG